MALTTKKVDSSAEGRRYASGSRTGSRTAANFSIALGFTPTHIQVTNLTDRISALHIVNTALDSGANAKSLLTVADGTSTYVDAGIALTAAGSGFTVIAATASLETANDDVIWSAWA